MLASHMLCIKKKKKKSYCIANMTSTLTMEAQQKEKQRIYSRQGFSRGKNKDRAIKPVSRYKISNVTMMHITEDTPPDMLSGAMDLTVHLPTGTSTKMCVERSTPMMDLLVQITTQNHLQISNYTLQALQVAPSAEYLDRVLPFKPNTPIGALDTQHIKVIPKNRAVNVPKNVPPGYQPFESTFRLKVHLPRNQLYVTRVSRNKFLGEIMREVCQEKNLDPIKYELRHPGNLDEILDPKLTLSDYQITEIYVVTKGTSSINQAFSSADIMTLRKEEERKQMHNKTGGGVFNLIFRRGKSSTGSGSVSTENCSISPTQSDDSRSVTPPATQPQFIAPPKEPAKDRPKPPQRKRRPAPKPPQIAPNGTGSDDHKGSTISDHSSTNGELSVKLDPAGLTISHSRNSSDSSGYHETSILSENNNSLPRRPKSTVVNGSLEHARNSGSTSNLANMSARSKSTSSLAFPGRKKKAAPPPPPLLKSASSVSSIDHPSPVVASQTTVDQIDLRNQPTASIIDNPKPRPTPRKRQAPQPRPRSMLALNYHNDFPPVLETKLEYQTEIEHPLANSTQLNDLEEENSINNQLLNDDQKEINGSMLDKSAKRNLKEPSSTKSKSNNETHKETKSETGQHSRIANIAEDYKELESQPTEAINTNLKDSHAIETEEDQIPVETINECVNFTLKTNLDKTKSRSDFALVISQRDSRRQSDEDSPVLEHLPKASSLSTLEILNSLEYISLQSLRDEMKPPPEVVALIPKQNQSITEPETPKSPFDSFTRKQAFRVGSSLVEDNSSIGSVQSALNSFDFVDEIEDVDVKMFRGSLSKSGRVAQTFNHLLGMHSLDRKSGEDRGGQSLDVRNIWVVGHTSKAEQTISEKGKTMQNAHDELKETATNSPRVSTTSESEKRVLESKMMTTDAPLQNGEISRSEIVLKENSETITGGLESERKLRELSETNREITREIPEDRPRELKKETKEIRHKDQGVLHRENTSAVNEKIVEINKNIGEVSEEKREINHQENRETEHGIRSMNQETQESKEINLSIRRISHESIQGVNLESRVMYQEITHNFRERKQNSEETNQRIREQKTREINQGIRGIDKNSQMSQKPLEMNPEINTARNSNSSAINTNSREINTNSREINTNFEKVIPNSRETGVNPPEVKTNSREVKTNSREERTNSQIINQKIQEINAEIREINKNTRPVDEITQTRDKPKTYFGQQALTNGISRYYLEDLPLDETELDWQYQLPSPPKAFKDSSPASLTNQETMSDSVVTSPELFEKLKLLKESETSDINPIEDKPVLSKLSLEHLEKRKSLVYNRELATSLKLSQEESELQKLRDFSESLKQFEETLEEVQKRKDEEERRRKMKSAATQSTLPNFKITTYDRPKEKINIFEDDTIRSNTDRGLRRSDFGHSMENISFRKGSLDEEGFKKSGGYKFYRPQSYFNPNGFVNRSESFSSEQNSWVPSRPVARSKSQVALNKYTEERLSSLQHDSEKSNSLMDVSGLQSLGVMRLIQNKLNTPTASTETMDTVDSCKKPQIEEPKREHPIIEQEPKASSPPKKIQNRGPPAINMGTWSERPKIPVFVKEDADYKLGMGTNKTAAKVTINMKPNNLSNGNENSSSGIYLKNNSGDRYINRNVSIKVNGFEPISQQNGNVVIKVNGTSNTSVSKVIDNNRFINHTTAVGYRKPLGNINKNTRPHSIAFSSDFDISRVPVVKSVELKKPFREANTSITQINHASRSPYDCAKELANPEKPEESSNIRAVIRTQSFLQQPATCWPKDDFTPNTNVPFSQVKLRRTDSKITNGDEPYRPPEPPRAPAYFNGTFKKPAALRQIVPPTNVRQIPPPDPRDQLLSAIRNFGGKKGLRSIKT